MCRPHITSNVYITYDTHTLARCICRASLAAARLFKLCVNWMWMCVSVRTRIDDDQKSARQPRYLWPKRRVVVWCRQVVCILSLLEHTLSQTYMRATTNRAHCTTPSKHNPTQASQTRRREHRAAKFSRHAVQETCGVAAGHLVTRGVQQMRAHTHSLCEWK